MRKAKAPKPVQYQYEPIGSGTTQGARPETHYTAFKRIPLPSAEAKPHSDDQEHQNEDDQDDQGRRRHRSSAIASSSKLPEGSGPVEEVFQIGDVVYLPSSYQAPLAGVLTHLWTLDDRVKTAKETIYGVVRLLHWPEWMSTMAKKRMAGLTSKNEIYYTHKAPKMSKRRSKTSIKTGEEGDDFESGPALHDYSFDVHEIISKAHIHASEQMCSQTIREAAALASITNAASDATTHRRKRHSSKPHCIYKGKSIPTHLFCERAVDPNRELFWKVDWSKLVKRGTQDGRWDLVDESSDELRALTQEGQRVNDVAVEMAEARSSHADAEERRAAADAHAGGGGDEGAPNTPTRSARASREPSASQAATPTSRPRRQAATPSKPFALASSDGSLTSSGEENGASDSDNSFQTGSEFDVEDELLIKALDDDTVATSEADSSDDDDDDLMRTPSRKRFRQKKFDPMTPSKRRVIATSPRKTPYGLSTPAKATATPRSRARLLGLKAKSLPHPSLPARPPKMSSLSVDELSALSPQERAKRLLHVGATPDHLPCREDQYEEIMACVEDAVEEGIGGCVYVSGVPGTGKTATVREVIRNLTARAERNEMNPFSFVEINGMKVADASQAYSLLWSAISGGQRAAPKTALNLLSSHFARVGAMAAGSATVVGGAGGAGVGAGPGRAATVVLMDELDQLVTARQDVMYNMFNWPNTRGSRLVVIAVANTMDLPERTLNPKVASRLGMTRIVFMPYTDRQLVEIVKSRLGLLPLPSAAKTKEKGRSKASESATKGCEDVFSPDAITYVSKRVSNVSGDARRMLDVCRRAVELVQLRPVSAQPAAVPASSSTAAAAAAAAAPPPALLPPRKVTIADMKSVLDSMVKSGKVSHILSLPLHGKILLLSLFSCLRRSGLVEADLGDVLAHHKAVCRMYAIVPPALSPMLASSEQGSTLGPAPASWDAVDFAPPVAQLCALGLVICVGQGAGTGRAGSYARLILACQEDEVRLAFGNDQDERLRKML